MSTTVYDFAIIGAGAAGLQLAMAMCADKWFADKQILLLEKEAKDADDRTWCYWEKGDGKWDSIIAKSWTQGKFITNKMDTPLHLPPYAYKMLHAIDFYNHAKKILAPAKNIHWVNDEVQSLVPREVVQIQGASQSYQAKHVFDSRIDAGFRNSHDHHHRILQHFKGWVIETEEPVFDVDTFVMMDYRVKWKDSTSFTYVLPTSPHNAMIEFTFFNLALLDYDAYDELLHRYIDEILQIKQYTISKVEYGVIPMSDYPFHHANSQGVTKIGTAGSWVKPSSGYAFKNTEKMVGKVIENIKAHRKPSQGLINRRLRMYDRIFLEVFSQYNSLGENVFERMYSKNSIQQIFKFLDEETNLIEELKIIKDFNLPPFWKALLFCFFRIRL